ncbi:D-amino-acid transaminase [Halobacillus litoralis]|uniref:D-alanine aminotransferase n=1 Tax=Halobacillus litoralis TaxID=45668 RepID=A0A410MAJ0_9BACI|nr:D-amino-acid transaminase [Halobacillus litoralis]QAS51754.1 D-amino-acid transaminase [Halobacillus litoralis]
MTIYNHILTENDFIEQDDLRYPFEERGLQFGDGIYEVIRVYDGKYYLIDEHVGRLYRSAAAVKINVPYKKEDMYKRLDELLEKNGVEGDAKVYLQITRGSAPRDHAFPADTDANLYAYVKDLPRPTELMREGVTAITQDDVRWDWCYIKSLNLLPNVLAKQAAKEQGSFEAILHKNGEVTECSSSNVYYVRDGSVYTHPAKKNILHGCVRMRIEAFCNQENIEFNEAPFLVEDIQYADELFLSSSTAEVMPILKVDGQTVGDGTPGPVTRTLQKCYEQEAGIPENKSIFSSQSATD